MTVISAWKAAPSLHTSSLVHPQSAYPTSTFHPWPVRQPEQRDPDSSFWRSKNRVVRKEWVKWRVKKKGGQSSEVSVLRSNHTVVAVAFFFFFLKSSTTALARGHSPKPRSHWVSHELTLVPLWLTLWNVLSTSIPALNSHSPTQPPIPQNLPWQACYLFTLLVSPGESLHWQLGREFWGRSK